MGGLGFAAGAGIVVYWRPPRSRGRRGQHPLGRLSSELSALGMFVQAASEMPLHHSPPSAAHAYVLPSQISSWETGPQNCSWTVQEENLVEMENVLGKGL